MRIGILSDSHDRADAMKLAVKTLLANGAEYLIHCGDVGAPEMLDHLAGVPSAFVWGNNDFDRAEMQRYAERLDITCLSDVGELELDGKLICVMHGDDERAKQRAFADQRFDYLLQGHTHIPADQRVGKTRVINPGALYRARQKTVAVLNTQTDALQFMSLEPRGPRP
jgi:putative phosphoesterase